MLIHGRGTGRQCLSVKEMHYLRVGAAGDEVPADTLKVHEGKYQREHGPKNSRKVGG